MPDQDNNFGGSQKVMMSCAARELNIFLLFTESLTEQQAKELADWISIILGKQKVSVVKV